MSGSRSPSRHYRETTFEREQLLLDGATFDGCRFHACHLTYRGLAPLDLTQCRADGQCQWFLNGSAALTIEALQALYHHGGDGARELVEHVVEQIRAGTWPREPRP